LSDDKERLVQYVQSRLRSVSNGVGKRIRVHASGVRLETPQGAEPYWWVPVLIDPSEKEMYLVYETLSDVEENFDFEGTHNVFLVPAILEFSHASVA